MRGSNASASRPSAVLLLLSLSVTVSAEPGVVFIETALRDRPSMSAAVVARLPARTVVDVRGSSRVWLEVSLPGGGQANTGWVRRYDVRLQDAAGSRGGSGGFGRLMGLFSRGSGIGSAPMTSTIGVRGLDAVDLHAARPAPDELRRLDSFRVAPTVAEREARRVGLAARSVDYLNPVQAVEKRSSGSNSPASVLDDW